MRRVTLSVSLCLVLAGCTREASCVEEPDNRFCQDACDDDPSLPHCDGVDAGPRIDGGDEDAGPRDGGVDAGDRDAGPPCGGPCDEGVCDPDTDTCVQCVGDGDCGGATPRCVANECVQCASHADCDEVDAARCDDDGACQPCEADVECAGIGDTTTCAAGTCVECEFGRPENQCGGMVCVDGDTCSESLVDDAVPPCGECEASEQCMDDGVCVASLQSSGLDEGARCVFPEAVGGGCESRRPYGYLEADAATVEETTVDVCRPRTTCAALATHGDPCGGGCGLTGSSPDARCSPSGTFCTYVCSADRHCPIGSSCEEGVGLDPDYCGE